MFLGNWVNLNHNVNRYCEGGELFFYILNKKSLTEKEAASIMKQSFSALKYLHENQISHRYFPILIYNRDIKPENFLLKNKDDISNIKMIDFGLSKDYSEKGVMQTPSGSVIYFNNTSALLHCTRSVLAKLQCKVWFMVNGSCIIYFIIRKSPFSRRQ